MLNQPTSSPMMKTMFGFFPDAGRRGGPGRLRTGLRQQHVPGDPLREDAEHRTQPHKRQRLN